MISVAMVIACAGFIALLFVQDSQANPNASKALWVPLLWMFFAGSRWASSWLDLSPPLNSADAYSEGSPIDRAVFFSLIVLGIIILAGRRLDWPRLLRGNKLLVLYFLFCLLSISWSDDPYVAFKRWFKDLGNPIMVLVILTTPSPLIAQTQLLRRLSFLFLPMSLLFVRYFPELGRAYKIDGSPMYTGIGQQKNDLGLMCLVAGIYFLWQIIEDHESFKIWSLSRRISFYILLVMLLWLLYMSDSQTSVTCLIAVAVVFLAGFLPFVRERPSRLIGLLAACGLTYFFADAVFDVKNHLLHLLGRDPSLTNRTEVWNLLISLDTNPILGAGFMSFWSGERMQQIWSVLGGINQAHSGYVEQYLNLGYVGVSFMVLLLLSAIFNSRKQLNSASSTAKLRICFIVAAILYNYTEASFYGISNMWLLTLLAMIEVPDTLMSTHQDVAMQHIGESLSPSLASDRKIREPR